MSWAIVYNYKYFQDALWPYEKQGTCLFSPQQKTFIYNTCIVLLHVEELSTIYFNHHLHAYNVVKSAPPVLRYIHQQQLLDAVPLSMLSLSLGYHIVSPLNQGQVHYPEYAAI